MKSVETKAGKWEERKEPLSAMRRAGLRETEKGKMMAAK